MNNAPAPARSTKRAVATVAVATWVSRLAPYATILGAIGLAIVSIDDVRDQFRGWFAPTLWNWGADNKIWVVVALAALTVIPSVVARAMSRRLQVDRDTKRNLELTTAAQSHSSRVAHLITKASDVRVGEVDDKYIGHTLVEACAYFKSRAIHTQGIDPAERVEACILRANWAGNGRDFFERERQTHINPGEFAYKLSSHKNPDAAALIKLLLSQSYFYADSADSIGLFQRAMKVDPQATTFKQFLAVPLLRDRKSVDQTRVWGVLVLMSTAPSMLRETDARLLETYGWFVSAAKALDTLATLSPSCTRQSRW